MPTTIAELLAWVGTHRDLFEANQAQIGISVAQATAFKTLADNLIAAESDAQIARTASKNATQKLSDNITAVRSYGQALIGVIRSHAETTNDPNVLVLAGLPPIQPPSQLPPPIAPDNLTATLESNGALRLSWRVAQPVGVTSVQYRIFRKLSGESSFTLVGTGGSRKTFLDESIPFGTDGLTYQIVPWRGEVEGSPSNQFTFQFGTGGGLLTIAATEGETKLAA
jgi:hypothetical protein